MKRVRSAVSGIILLAFAATAASAQGFGVGYTDIGPVIGLGGIGDASFSIGGRFEKGIKALPDMGNGTLGIMVGADWYSYSYKYLTAESKLTYIPITATANYHFNVTNKKFDPFIGLGLGYLVANTSVKVGGATIPGGSYDASGLYFAGRLGARYMMGEKASVFGDVGTGGGALHVGMTFKVGGA